MNAQGTMTDAVYDLVVIGGNAGGLSVAMAMQQAGLRRVRIVEETSAVGFAELVGEHQLDVGFGEVVRSIDLGEGQVSVTTDRHTYTARAVVVAHRANPREWTPPAKAVPSDRILVDRLPAVPVDEDVLVVGHTDQAVEFTAALAAAGARVVLAARGIAASKLSVAGQTMLQRLEKERKATILYRSVPDQVSDDEGFPMAYFGDRRTPDLEFDYVVFASGRTPVPPSELGLTEAAAASGQVCYLGEVDFADVTVPAAPADGLITALAPLFPELHEAPSRAGRRRAGAAAIEELREQHYNAVITLFEPTHSDLWVLRVKPDHGETSHLPGQYASLGLGHWEERIDDAVDPNLEERWDKLVRRSYSISSRMFDQNGYLTGDLDSDELEFYIVLVPPTDGNVPGLTPRLALKKPGDRIYLGPKVAGRYTLSPVTDPNSTVLFCATGTGEAPHNAMVVELLRKAHRGPIVSAVSVRKWVDLGYIEKHRKLEELYPNYHYLPMPTREADVPKRYIQDVIANEVLEEQYAVDLDPASTNVFLCGNPAMIGLPEEKDGEKTFPEVRGVVELLSNRGFTLDHRGHRGNVHVEEYW